MEALLSSGADFSFETSDSSHVAAARSTAQRLARSLDFDETGAGRLAIVVSEAVTNMLKHAGGGTLVVRSLARDGAIGIEVLAIDSGPGMTDVPNSRRDGVSTTGTSGNGLGAMQRLSHESEVYSYPGGGTIVRMMLWAGEPPLPPGRHEIGAICIPKPGETVCGDAWEIVADDDDVTFMVADGLGHGPDANRASVMAVDVLRRHSRERTVRLLDLMHARLRPTRGAAVAVMRHEAATQELAFAGVGNIAAVVIDGVSRRAAVSHAGIVGHNIHKSLEYRYPWSKGGMLVAHSDGLESQWDLGALPGINACHASVIAAALYRRHSRKRDDCTILVAKALR